MASDRSDPATDPRADYDYVTQDVARPALVADLEPRVDGEVRFDDYTRQLYARDASAYEVTPVGVVYPCHRADVEAVVSYCAVRGLPVLPRGGGTSLAGQAVNEAVVLDFTRYMDEILVVDPEAHEAVAQPGVRLGDLDETLAEHDLKFAPDPAWGDKSVLGGAIGNNSTGSHSLVYGKTDAYVEELECVLSDGSVARFGEVAVEELPTLAERAGIEGDVYAFVDRLLAEEAETVRDAYPDLSRTVSGYNFDRVVDEAASGHVNVARLLAGSEGTLAVVTEATVSLEPVPETEAVALLGYADLVSALRDVEPILEHDPCAVEVMDDVLLDLAGETTEFAALVDAMVPEGVDAMLLVEFYADSDDAGRTRVADLLADRYPDGDTRGEPSDDRVATGPPVLARSAAEAHEPARREEFWTLRKAGLPILLSRTGEEKHISFIEDTAVPPEHLPEYVEAFQAVLDEHDTFASFYAHAGPGCLHIRPLIDTASAAGVAQMESIADAATDLVVEFGGSVSGEHGDGRARTRWNRKQYGDRVVGLFRDLKAAFDPEEILNPGQVCGDVDLTENLRFGPGTDVEVGFEPSLHWETEGGMAGMVDLCHGCGGCRGPQETTGGVMCPTYRAANEESLSTRGRATMLQRAMGGEYDLAATDPAFLREVLDLCIGCKGCAHDCPSEVDMAKLKAEVDHAHLEEHGASLRDHLFANVDAVASVGSRTAPLSNLLARLPGAGWLAERMVGVAREATLPRFASESFEAWYAKRGPAVDREDATRRALLFPDTYANYVSPAVARDAVLVLEAAGVRVEVPDTGPSGRAAHSKGFLDTSRSRAAAVVDAVGPRLEDRWDLVAMEPSDAVMFQRDYVDLLGPDAEPVPANSYGLCEYIDHFRLDEAIDWDARAATLTYHGHCHQKATKRDHHAVAVLRRAGYAVDALDSGCCGMAGSFGYEAEHRSMSDAIASVLRGQIRESDGETVVAPGSSCRTRLTDDERSAVPHPVEELAAALPAP